MRTRRVLDAWALLALLQAEEPAASRVKSLVVEAQNRQSALLVSVVNLGEVYFRIGKQHGEAEAETVLSFLRQLPLEIVSASDEMVMAAARFKMGYAVSYADAFAAALSLRRRATLVTGDPELLALQGVLTLESLHRRPRGSRGR